LGSAEYPITAHGEVMAKRSIRSVITLACMECR